MPSRSPGPDDLQIPTHAKVRVTPQPQSHLGPKPLTYHQGRESSSPSKPWTSTSASMRLSTVMPGPWLCVMWRVDLPTRSHCQLILETSGKSYCYPHAQRDRCVMLAGFDSPA